MQGRSELDIKCGEVNSLLEKVALCDATPSNDVYLNIITALNELTKTNSLDKYFRASYRKRLSEALSARIKIALKTKNKPALIEEKTGLEKVIKEVVMLQGSGGFLRFAKQKTAAQAIQNLIIELDKAIPYPKVVQLRDAICRYRFAHLEELLEEGVDANCKYEEWGMAPLHFAMNGEGIKCVQLLLKYKANPNQVDDGGDTPLHILAKNQKERFWDRDFNLAAFNELIKHGVNVYSKNNEGFTPLACALLGSKPDLAIQLIAVMVEKTSPFAVSSSQTIYACLIEALNQAYQSDKSNGRTRGDIFSGILSKLVSVFKDKLVVVINTKNPKLLEGEFHGLRAFLDEVELLKNGTDSSEKVVEALNGYINKIEKNLKRLELFDLVAKGDLEKVKALIASDVEIGCQDDKGRTLLYIASREGHEDIVRFLIDQKVDINQANNNGVTPLYVAAKNGHAGIVEALIEEGADFNKIRSWLEVNTALCVSIHENHQVIVEFLLNTMIQKSSTSPENETIYSLLIETLNHEILKPIYNKNQLLTTNICTWLADALSEKVSTVVRRDPANIEVELKGLHAIINEVDLLNGAGGLGVKKRAVAAIRKCIETLEVVLNQRKAVEVDPSKALFEAAIEGDLEKVKVLIEKGVDINCQDELGRTPLYRAAGHGRVAVVEFLIRQKANVNLALDDGATPLHVAAQEGHKKIVQILLKNNADVNQAWKGITPLYIALVNDHVAVVDLFKDHLNKKIRSHLFEENGKLVASPQCYNDLIAYLNHQCTSYNKLKFTRKATRLFLTTALHERVNEVMTPAKPDNELLKNEKAGLDLMIKSLELLQPTGIPPTKKHAMKEIEDWSAALGVKIEHPDLVVTIDPPRAQKKSLTGAIYATFFGGSAKTPQVDSEQTIVPSRPDGSAQAFHSSL